MFLKWGNHPIHELPGTSILLLGLNLGDNSLTCSLSPLSLMLQCRDAISLARPERGRHGWYVPNLVHNPPVARPWSKTYCSGLLCPLSPLPSLLSPLPSLLSPVGRIGEVITCHVENNNSRSNLSLHLLFNMQISSALAGGKAATALVSVVWVMTNTI